MPRDDAAAESVISAPDASAPQGETGSKPETNGEAAASADMAAAVDAPAAPGNRSEPAGRKKGPRTFTHDLISVVSSRIIGRSCQFLASVAAARLIGPGGRGLIAALAVAPDLAVSFSQLGMRQSVAYFIGNKTYDVAEIVPTLIRLVFFANITAVGASLTYYYFAGLLNQSWVLIVLALAPIPFFLMSNYTAGVLLGKQMIIRFNRVDWVPMALNLILVIALGWLGGRGIIGVMMATVAAAMLGCSYALYLLRTLTPLRFGFDREIAARITRLGAVYGLAMFMLLLNYRIPILLLHNLSTLREVGIYAVGQTLAQIVWEMPAMLSNLVLSRGVNTQDSAGFGDKVVVLARLVVFAGAGAALGCMIVAPYVIPLIYGAKFADSATVLSILLPGTVAFMAFKILQMDIMRRGHPWVTVPVVVPCMAANAGFGLLVVPEYGAAGAATLTSASYVLATAVYILVYARVTKRSVSSIVLYRRSDFSELLRRLRRVRV